MTQKNKTLSLVEQAAALLGEQVVTGGGATGQSKGPTLVAAAGGGAHANRPQDKAQADSMNRGQNPAGTPIEDTSTENNVSPTGDNSEQNRMSVAMKSVREDVDAMFTGHDVSEEFKVKASTIFEAAINARVAEIQEQILEDTQVELQEAVEIVKEELATKIDDYMSYVVEQWMLENEIAIEGGLRSDISESFMTGLHSLFNEHYISVPDEQIDVAEQLVSRVEELEQDFNNLVNENIELKTLVQAAARDVIIDSVVEGLVETQKAKLSTLFEGVDFESPEDFKEKLETIKAGYIGNSTSGTKKESIKNLLEEVNELTEQSGSTDAILEPQVRSYVDAISRTTLKK